MDDSKDPPLEHGHTGDQRVATTTPISQAFKIAFLCLCACNFISILDTVIVASALPAITIALDATSDEAYWCGSAFLFAQAVSQPLYGALSEVFGRKVCLIVALSLFTVSSLFCATAQNITWLVVSRVVSKFPFISLLGCRR